MSIEEKVNSNSPGSDIDAWLSAKTKGFTNGMGKGQRVKRKSGFTNGTGRRDGLVNGTGVTNGLTNGLVNGTGLTNGLTNGLVNGTGVTNGLTNGLVNGTGVTNGLTNGLAGPLPGGVTLDERAISPKKTSLVIIIVVLLLIPSIFMMYSYEEPTFEGPRVDGNFSEWSDVSMFADTGMISTPGLDISEYGLTTNEQNDLFLYVQVKGGWMSSTSADSLCIFVDDDDDDGTGYSIDGFGADYLLEVYGWDNAIQGRLFKDFDGTDQANWSAWGNGGRLSAAVSGSQMEISVPATSQVFGPNAKFMLMTKRGEEIGEMVSAHVAPDKGALVIKQTPSDTNDIMTTDSVMQLDLTAFGLPVTVNSISFEYKGVQSTSVSGLPVTVSVGATTSLSVTAPVTTLAQGTYIELGVSSVTSDGTAHVIGNDLKAYANAPPSSIEIDGAFADWAIVSKSSDTANDAGNSDIDITDYASVNSTTQAYFYVKVNGNGELFTGGLVPQARERPESTGGPTGEPGEPAPPKPLPRKTGEDITRIFVDTVPGGQNVGGIGADYLIEVTGINGEITGKRLFSLPGKHFVKNLDAANGVMELEVGLALTDIGYTGNLTAYFETTDWQKDIDQVTPLVIVPAPLPTGTRGILDPDWGGVTTNTAVCTATAAQRYPQIIPDGQGGAIIAWQDNRNGNSDIYAQRVSATGTPLWTAGGVAVCTATEAQENVQLIPDGQGGAIIAWEDSRDFSYMNYFIDIYAQRVSSSGTTLWTANGVAVCAYAYEQQNLQLVPDGQGGAIIAWEDHREPGNWDIYAQRVSASGSILWGHFPVCGLWFPGDQLSPQLIPDGQGGAIITWESNYVDVYAQRVSPSGTTIWTFPGFAVCTGSGGISNPNLVPDGEGGAIIAWSDFRNGNLDIYAQRVSPSGSAVWTANGEPICTVSGGQESPQIVSDGQGGAIISWLQWGLNYDIFAQRVDADGSTLWASGGIEVCYATGSQRYQKMASDGQGGALIVWTDYRDQATTSYDIYAQRLDKSGVQLWAKNGLAVCTATGSQEYPAITIENRWLFGNQQGQSPEQVNTANDFKGIILVWEDARSGTDDIYAQAINEDAKEFIESHILDPRWGSAGTNLPVCTAANNQRYHAMIPDGQGGTIIAWQDGRNVWYDIFAQRISADGTPLWTPDGVAICTAGNSQFDPQLTTDGQGGAIITWEDNRAADNLYDVYAQRVDADGNTLWTSDGVAVGATNQVQDSPQIVSDGQGGAIIGWEDSRSGSFKIYSQRVSSTGSLVWSGGTGGVAVSTTLSDHDWLRMTSDGQGGAIYTWHDSSTGNYDIYANRLNNAGAGVWGSLAVTQGQPGFQMYPEVISDGQGGAIVAWQDNRGTTTDIWAERISATGTRMWWPGSGWQVCTATGTQSMPTLASDGQGGAIITWGDTRSGGWDIYAQRIKDASVKWTADGIPICTYGSDQSYPEIIPDGNGGCIIAWRDTRNGGANLDIYSQRVTQDGSIMWTTNGIPVSTRTGSQYNQQIVSDGLGGAIVSTYDVDIYAQRISYLESTVVINEVMFDPSSGNDWVELANPTLVDYNISGWTLIDDSDTIIYTVPTTTALNAGGYMVFEVSTSLEANDAVALWDSANAMRDYVAWGALPTGDNYSAAVTSANWFSGEFIDTTGFVQNNTIGRDMFSTDTDTVSDWEITCGINTDVPTPNLINAPEFPTPIIPLFVIIAIPLIIRRKRKGVRQ